MDIRNVHRSPPGLIDEGSSLKVCPALTSSVSSQMMTSEHPASRTTQWRWISGILGILCLLLLTLLGVLLSKGYPSCCSCPEGWIGYQCSCYFISKEQKSWEASRNFCESKNSSLLQMYSKEELGFVRRSRYFYWIGVSYNKDRRAWFWLNGSAFSPALFKEPQAFNTKKCITYKPGEGFLDDSLNGRNSGNLTSSQETDPDGQNPVGVCQPCEDNWHQYGANCYSASLTLSSWSNCDLQCSTKDSSFLKLNTEKEMDFVKTLTKMLSLDYNRKFWISVRYNRKQEKWTWLDDSAFTLDK
nr:unnamed protein product [Sorex araneus]